MFLLADFVSLRSKVAFQEKWFTVFGSFSGDAELTNISVYHRECWESFTLPTPVAFTQMYLSPSTTCFTSQDLAVQCFFQRDPVRQAFRIIE